MEMALAGTPTTSNMGLRMCAPVIMEFGADEQKQQHLPRILKPAHRALVRAALYN